MESNFSQNPPLHPPAARYARAERELKQARPYGHGAQRFYEVTEIEKPAAEPKELFIAMTSDRGLCGAIHTGVARSIRNELTARDNIDNTGIVCVGDKSRAILQRLFAKNFVFVANEIGRLPPTFLDASKIAREVLTSGYDYTHGKIVYNKFRTVVSYALSELPIFSLKSVEVSGGAASTQSKELCNAYWTKNVIEFRLCRAPRSWSPTTRWIRT